MTTVRVEVRGLRELSGAFKQVDAGIQVQLRSTFRGIAQDVANRAASGVPRQTGAAAGSIKPRASVRGAGIAFGGAAAPYYPWLDFGGAVGRNNSVRRSFIPDGRYVYPAIKSMRTEIEEAALDAVEQAAKGAGFEVRGR